MTFAHEVIWIIGASSGIGAALARDLSDQGATLCLSSRREEDLENLNQDLGGHHFVYPLDVTDFQALDAATSDILMKHKVLHRVIFMAALYQPGKIAQMDLDFAKTLLDVNVMGAFYVTRAVLGKTKQLALCASVAGYTGLPNGQPYSASKAALINFAETLCTEHPELDVKLINPGFVRTPLTDKNDFPMPWRLEPEQAAKAIATGLKKKRFEIHFPKRLTLILKLLQRLPYGMKLWVMKKL